MTLYRHFYFSTSTSLSSYSRIFTITTFFRGIASTASYFFFVSTTGIIGTALMR